MYSQVLSSGSLQKYKCEFAHVHCGISWDLVSLQGTETVQDLIKTSSFVERKVLLINLRLGLQQLFYFY
jgi:hypothetical protein